MDELVWFNLWHNKLWPYNELQPGDEVFWYESPSRKIVWRSRVVQVESFPYAELDSALDRLDVAFGCAIDRKQDYLEGKPSSGYCLGYRIEAQQRLEFAKPAHVRFNQQGWERADRPEIKDCFGT
jgi:hypothetical protein